MDLFVNKCTNCGRVLITDVNPPPAESWGLGCPFCGNQENPEAPYLWNLLGTLPIVPPSG